MKLSLFPKKPMAKKLETLTKTRVSNKVILGIISLVVIGAAIAAGYGIISGGLPALLSAPTANLVGYWNFDENQGNAVNNTASGAGTTGGQIWYSGQSQPAPYWPANTPPWTATAVKGSALTFTGFRSYTRLATNLTDIANNQISISYWLYLNKLPTAMVDYSTNKPIAYPAVFDKYTVQALTGARDQTSYQQYFAVWSGAANKLSIKWFDTVGGVHDGSPMSITTFETNKWYHLAWVFNGTDSKLYVNGVLDSSSPVASGLKIKPLTGSLSLSSFANSLDGGIIDEVKIYNRALTEDEIVSLSNEIYEGIISRCVVANASTNYKNYPVSCNAEIVNIPDIVFTIDPIKTTLLNIFGGPKSAGAPSNASKWMAACIPYATGLCHKGYGECVRRSNDPKACQLILDICLNSVQNTCLNWDGKCSASGIYTYRGCMEVPSAVYCPNNFPAPETCGPQGGCGCMNFEKEWIAYALKTADKFLCATFRNTSGYSVSGSSVRQYSTQSDEFLCKVAGIKSGRVASWPHHNDENANAVDIFFDKYSSVSGTCDANCVKAGHDFMENPKEFALYNRLSAIDELIWSSGDNGHVHLDIKRRGKYSDTTNEPCFKFYYNYAGTANPKLPDGGVGTTIGCSNSALY